MQDSQNLKISRPQKIIFAILAILLIAGVLQMYLDPEFMVRVADMVWSCL